MALDDCDILGPEGSAGYKDAFLAGSLEKSRVVDTLSAKFDVV